MIGEDILLEIDQTLDQLIRNAETIEHIELKELSGTEVDAFEKTQESLLKHLLYMDELLGAKLKTQNKRLSNAKIEEKFSRFEKMNLSYEKNISKLQKKLPILSKRKAKRLLG